MTNTVFLDKQLIIGIILVLGYFSFLIAEHKWPLRTRTRTLLSRMTVNLIFTALVYIVAGLLISPLAEVTIRFTQTHHIGLLSLFPFNTLSHFILGFLLMDITFYYWHRMNHEIPLLWRFHNVHHIDPDLDVTTSMRFHLVEIAYSSIFRVVQLGVIGIHPLAFICYEFIFQANTFFHHSNLKLPIRFERLLNRITVTPRMHGIHHSTYRDETNCNYGVVFSFWDRLHKTIKLNIPQQTLTIGVPGYQQLSDNRLKNLLLMPFKAQRSYWQINGKTHIHRDIEPLDRRVGELAE